MADRATVQYDTAIICDDVRPEVSGKMVLVGVTSSELVFQSFPSTVTLCVYAEGVVHSGGIFSTTVRVLDDGGAILFDTGPSTDFAHFVLGRFAQVLKMNIVLQRETVISVLVHDGDREHRIIERAVKLIPPNPLPSELLATLARQK